MRGFSASLVVWATAACSGAGSGGALPDMGGCDCAADDDCPPGTVCFACECRSAGDGGVIGDLVVGCDDLDFGSPLVGTEVARAAHLENTGDGPVTVYDLIVDETDATAEYALEDVPRPLVIEPGDTRDVEVVLRPTDAEADLGRLFVVTNDGTRSCDLYSELKGDPVLHVCQPTICGDGDCCTDIDVLDFGYVPWGEERDADVRIENLGDGNRPLVVTGVETTSATFVTLDLVEDMQELPFLLNPAGPDGDPPPTRFGFRVTFAAEDPDSLFEGESVRVGITNSAEDPPDSVLEIPIVVTIDGCSPGCWDLDTLTPGCEFCGCEFVSDTDPCNGEDEDCDGDVDEDFDPSVCGVGVCAEDAACIAGKVLCGVAADLDSVCDGEDDDCDGETDEDYFPIPCDGPDLDLCAEGMLECVAGAPACSDTGGDGVETCNGVDDDCDGAIDEGGNACGGACALSATPGTPCDSPDDLDGCADDMVACVTTNLIACGDGGIDADGDGWSIGAALCGGDCDDLDEDVSPGAAETCNGDDDDCDLAIDEGFNLCGGVCALATAPGTACDSTGDDDTCMDDFFTCAGANDTACADFDTDSDDDGYSPGAPACDGDCADADGARHAGVAETCNALDDDCDGTVDEGFGIGTPCDGPDADLCPDGVIACGGCTDVTPDNVEICNGLDDDCNAAIDETFDFTSPVTCGTCTNTCALGESCDAGACVVPPVGSVIVTEVMADPTAVADTLGEWFEVYNTAAYAIDLRNWQIYDPNVGSQVHTIAWDEPVLVPAGAARVLAIEADSAINGGVPGVLYEFDNMTLGNAGDDVGLRRGDGTVIDEVAWPAVAAGAARNLTPAAFSATDNDVAANWCNATTAYGSGDLGTPGGANITCP